MPRITALICILIIRCSANVDVLPPDAAAHLAMLQHTASLSMISDSDEVLQEGRPGARCRGGVDCDTTGNHALGHAHPRETHGQAVLKSNFDNDEPDESCSQYEQTTAGHCDCPAGSEPLEDATECQKATACYGFTRFDDNSRSSTAPAGCFSQLGKGKFKPRGPMIFCGLAVKVYCKALPTPAPTDGDTAAPTRSPTEGVTVLPTPSPTEVVTDMPTSSSTEAATTRPAVQATGSLSPPVAMARPVSSELMSEADLDFCNAQLAHNNLGGFGPDGDDRSLVFAGVTIDDAVSLIVTNVSVYAPWNISVNGPHGILNCFGALSLKCGEQVTLRFSFVDTLSKRPIMMKRFNFTVLDIDSGINGRCKESVEVSGYSAYTLSSDSTVVEDYDMGTIRFKASAEGTGDDDPTDLAALTVTQKTRGVNFLFHDVQTFTLTFFTDTDQNGSTDLSVVGHAGRKLLWSAGTSLLS